MSAALLQIKTLFLTKEVLITGKLLVYDKFNIRYESGNELTYLGGFLKWQHII